MTSLIARLLVALVLFAVAVVFGAEARQLQTAADVHEHFATLKYDSGQPGQAASMLSSWLSRADLSVARRGTVDLATSDYWQGRYDRLVNRREDISRDPDPELLLLAANAAYRASQQAAQPRQAQSQQLDVVLQAYATVLKSAAFVPDAAYNYEYVARVRDALGRTRAAASARPESPASVGGARQAGDLPAGPTIHGRPGGPPPGTKGEEFEIITPMEFGDREAQPEPNAGGRPLRKG